MVSVNTVVAFNDLKFFDDNNNVRVVFLGRYYFFIPKSDLLRIGSFSVSDGKLFFDESEERVFKKLDLLLDKGFRGLRHSLRDKDCLYVHRNSGIPLIGSNEFGVVDRGSNVLEIKPLTGCNLSCIFCSVSEGVNNKRDIIVEEEYLVEVFSMLASVKEHPVEANIGPQGEPLLYPKIVDLVRDLKANGASVVSINTNGTLLSERLVDELFEAGLDRINLSLHALDQDLVDKLMSGHQDVQRLLRIIRYCEGKIDVLLAPVLIPGFNDEAIDGIIEFSKSIRNKRWPSIGVQNFLDYPGGRNPGVKPLKWEAFFDFLRQKEKDHGVKLLVDESVFGIVPDRTLPKPFRKGETVSVVLKAPGRNPGEWLGVASDRVVTVRSCFDCGYDRRINVRIVRDKHNIFIAVPKK